MPSQEELLRLDSMTHFEKEFRKRGFQQIAGVDEAGRGPLAGPVVAACCILPQGALFPFLNDSKQLKSSQRESLYLQLINTPGVFFGIGSASVEEIDALNILRATFLAMERAVFAMPSSPDLILIDGNRKPPFLAPAECIVGGDGRSVSIAAASIFAKVTRDRMMETWHARWPEYGFLQHKGYGTVSHLEAIQKYGPCPLHRKTFSPIKNCSF